MGYAGPYDLRTLDGLNSQQSSILINFVGLPFIHRHRAELASPVAQIGDEKLPFFLVHAVNDNIVPVRSSQQFADALKEKLVPVQYVEPSDGGHSVWLFDKRPFAQEASCAATTFLTNFLKGN